MACNVVQPSCQVPSSVADHNSWKPHENAPDHFIADSEQFNKVSMCPHAMPLLDVTEVGSEEMDLGYEAMPLLDVSEVGSEEMNLGHELQMAHKFYVSYVKKVGFATKIQTTTYDRITKQPINQAIHCNRDGFHESRVKASTQKNTISAAGCKARIYVKFDKEKQEWIFLKVELWHSHPCSARKVDARCRASYKYYGDVVSVDSTYSTNRHGLLFASFVGVNHHGKSTFLGCALLGNEEIPSYEWVFSQWVKCMGTAPQRIITDQCRSIFRAIRNVLPDTRHRWCIWHIMKKLPHKLGGYCRYRELYDDLNDIVWNSQTVEAFEDDWSEFIAEYNLHNNPCLSDLYDDRRMWVPIYFKGEFWASMRSTQRSESMHSFYGGFLHSRTSLVQFVHEYDNVLGIKEQRELEDNAADTRGVIPCATSSPMERQFQHHEEHTKE
ncbi:protein FAR1-RELATED SEQUENCE 5-like [Arachis ipaensis]|uniref:protein FAR1-RELATED SEQUENCE 5-like n=1 Tax=Arachis ipaensis TaxID=130454 RepID=UPI0007AF220B|nr:protein FAR1-RELATED SEQUENCE 5-like [Arachis ipaensis]